MPREVSDRAIAEAAGYDVREGSYRDTTDDRVGRYYVGRDGHPFRPFAPGFSSRAAAWAAAADQARAEA